MSIQLSPLIKKRILDESIPERRLVVTPILDPPRQLHFEENSASIDLRLGSRFAVARRGKTAYIDTNKADFAGEFASLQDEYYVPVGKYFVLHPNHFVLGETLEYVRLPVDLAAYVVTRSSWGRHGLAIATAIGIHPLFCGVITLELRNMADIPIYLYPGKCVLQLFFHLAEGFDPSLSPDSSAYRGATGPGIGTSAFDADEVERIKRFPNYARYPLRSSHP